MKLSKGKVRFIETVHLDKSADAKVKGRTLEFRQSTIAGLLSREGLFFGECNLGIVYRNTVRSPWAWQKSQLRAETSKPESLSPTSNRKDFGGMLDVILKRFERPDEIMTFEKGKFEIVHVGGMTIGRASYEPGWRWSDHISRKPRARSCAWSSTLAS